MVTSSGAGTPTPLPGTNPLLRPLDRPDEPAGAGIRGILAVFRRRRRIFLVTTAAVTVIAGLMTIHRRITSPVYTGGFTLLISDPINVPTGGDEAIGTAARNVTQVDVPTLIRVLESPSVLEPVYQQLSQQFPDIKPPQIGVNLISADAGGNNNFIARGLLGVDARGSNPDQLREALRLTEAAYLKWSLEQRREQLNEGVRFLDKQAPELRAKVGELQQELERFRRTHNVLEPTEEATALQSQAQGLRNQLTEQQSERQRLMRLRSDVANGKLTARSFSATAGGEGSDASVSLDVPNQSMLEELNTLEKQIAEAQSKYQPDSPLLRNLIASRDKLRPALQAKEVEALDAAIEQADLSIATTRRQIASLENQFQSQPALLREYEDLQRRLETAQGNLDSYQSTRDQFQLQIAQNTVPWKITSPTGVNPNPVEPNLGRGLLQGLLIGLVAGGGVALLRDRLDHVFHSPREVRNELKVPLLGHVPHIPFFNGLKREKRFLLRELDSQQSGIGGYQRFAYQEALRNLYSSLRFLRSGRPVKSVAISSSLPSEGKSLVVVLLAKTLTELGQRVLLIDGDLRQPQIHHRLGLDNLQGLSSLLTDESMAWRSVVHSMPDAPNWDVLTAGRPVPDPPRLLGSPRMAQLVREIAETGGYDMVLYDTPPALGLADASLLAENLDGILLVVGLGKVDRDLPAQAIERIEAAGAPLLGVVTNALTIGSESSNGLGYGYGYGGYGYGTSDTAAHDPSLAYNYYRGSQGEEPAAKGGINRYLPTPRNLRRWGRSLSNWMDGSAGD